MAAHIDRRRRLSCLATSIARILKARRARLELSLYLTQQAACRRIRIQEEKEARRIAELQRIATAAFLESNRWATSAAMDYQENEPEGEIVDDFIADPSTNEMGMPASRTVLSIPTAKRRAISDDSKLIEKPKKARLLSTVDREKLQPRTGPFARTDTEWSGLKYHAKRRICLAVLIEEIGIPQKQACRGCAGRSDGRVCKVLSEEDRRANFRQWEKGYGKSCNYCANGNKKCVFP